MMAFVIGDEEYKFLTWGVIVATLAAARFKCPTCKTEELKLVRVIDLQGDMKPAQFECSCGHVMPPSPDLETGSVYPALSGRFNESGTRTGRQSSSTGGKAPKFNPGGYGGGWQ